MKLTLQTKLIPKDATVIAGVSGGRDSMALTYALRAQRPDLKIVAAHVNHGLRPSSKSDADFVKGMMIRWEIPLETLAPKPPQDGNIEEWGRNKRYEFFTKLLKKHHATFIITAHHQNDDFESMLLHFVRGTRVKGLSGMQLLRENILRPLLYTSRAEIDAYISVHEIPYRDDPTNEDPMYSRNFLRNKVVPVLNHMYPGLAEKWQKQKPYWFELQAMLEESAQNFLNEFLTADGLSRQAYKKLGFPLRATILELWYKKSTGKMVEDSATLERWDNALLTFTPRKKTEWDGKKFLVMSKERGRIN
jgi:tRNA(Ile)-lysidine synthase